MWTNSTVIGFTDGEKKWFASLSAPMLQTIGFDVNQRTYIKNYLNTSAAVKRPKGFKKHPYSFPKKESDLAYYISIEQTETYFAEQSTAPQPLSFTSDNPTVIGPIPAPVPSQSIQPQNWTDTKTANLPPLEKKWLAGRPTPELRSLGFNYNQIDHIRSFRNVSGLAAIPVFVLSHTFTSHNPFIVQSSNENEVQDEDETPEETSSINPLIETTHDLEVKYLDCFGKKGDDIIKAVGFISNGDKNCIRYRKIGPNGGSSTTLEDVFNSSFEFTLPKLGMINYDDHVIYVERIHKKSSPARYRKGLRGDTLKFYNLSSKELKSINKIDITNSSIYSHEDGVHRLVRYMMLPKMFTFKEAIDEVLSFNRLSAAFTSSFAIRLDSTTNKIILHKYNWTIGEYNFKNNVFEMYIDTFNNDLIKLNVPLKVAA